MTGNAEGTPRYVEPAVASQELVGILTCLKERDELLELLRILGADVGGLALQVLGVADTANLSVNPTVAEAGVDDDGAADGLAGGLQQLAATISHVLHLLLGRDVVRVLL